MPSRAEMSVMGLFFLRDVIDLTQTTKLDACVLSIDFYKAFDCVDHIFLKKVLKCSGFSDIFCDRIFALFQNSETAVIESCSLRLRKQSFFLRKNIVFPLQISQLLNIILCDCMLFLPSIFVPFYVDQFYNNGMHNQINLLEGDNRFKL